MRQRKPSTPDEKRKKRKINLFERNNVDYLVDNHAIQIENNDNLPPKWAINELNANPERKTLPIDGLNTSNFKSEKSKHKGATLATIGFIKSSKDDEEDTTGPDSLEQEEEVQISLIIKDEPKITVIML